MPEPSSLHAWATAAGIAAGVFLLIALVVVILRRQFRNASATANRIDDVLLDLARRTHLWLMLPVAAYAGSRALTLPFETASMIATAARLALIAQSAIWCVAIIDIAIARYRERRLETDPAAITTIRGFQFAAVFGLWVVAVLVALDNLGIDVTALVAGLGIGGVAIALAVQNILGDLFASLSIVLDKPFVVGDVIATGDQIGIVEQIGLKTTRVRALSGEQVIFANSDLLSHRIRNYKRMSERRVVFRAGVVYETPAEKLERIPEIARSIIAAAGSTRFDRAHFASFGDSSYDFEFVYYVDSPDYNLYMDVQQRINLGLVRAFESEEIDFAYPTRTLLLRNGSPVELHRDEPTETATKRDG